jgi:ABC-type bacteriocin/lantibiotic exporter with double-glycine peptidase domain
LAGAAAHTRLAPKIFKKNKSGEARMEARAAPAEAPSWLPWALQAVATLHRQPFDAALMQRQFPPPHDESTLIHAARQLGFRADALEAPCEALAGLPLPALLCLRRHQAASYALLLKVDDEQAQWLQQGEAEPEPIALADIGHAYAGRCYLFKPHDAPLT